MNTTLRQPITEDEIQRYEADGAVAIRGQFDAAWVERMRRACERVMANPQGFHREVRDASGGGRFFGASFMHRHDSEFRAFALESPAAEIAARVMRVDAVRFLFDQMFVKEPGTEAPTHWHHDLPFLHFAGTQLGSVWVALTRVSREMSAVEYVAGSHRWGTLYRAVGFARTPEFEDPALEPCPDFGTAEARAQHRYLMFDLEPGDCIVHHPLTVHGSGRNHSATDRRIGLAVRYFGGDVVWHPRRTGRMFDIPEGTPGVVPGRMPTNDAYFPPAWRAASVAG